MNVPTRLRHRRGTAAAVVATALTAALVGAVPAQAAAGFSFDTRLSGATRVDTAVSTSKALYPTAGSQNDVVVVNQSSLVDGLTASYVAGLKNAPILFTDAGSVPQQTTDEIARLGAKNVWIVGGTTVVSANLEQTWKSAGKTVTRYAGDDRYATAAAVATAGEFEQERVYMTSGTTLADAVVVGPISWARQYPILLTKADGVPSATSTALTALGTPARTVIGGTTAVSDSTYSALGATGRLGGADRQATAVAVADDAVATASFTHGNAGLVGGTDANAVDALAAAALAGATGTPLLYIKGNDAVGTTTAAYLSKYKAELVPGGKGYVLGGTSAISAKAVTEATAAAQ